MRIWLLISVLALGIAAIGADLPYAYFQLLRWLVCGVAIWGALKGPDHWRIAHWVLAVLFNPIAPIHFDRGSWAVIDILSAFLLVAFLVNIKADNKLN